MLSSSSSLVARTLASRQSCYLWHFQSTLSGGCMPNSSTSLPVLSLLNSQQRLANQQFHSTSSQGSGASSTSTGLRSKASWTNKLLAAGVATAGIIAAAVAAPAANSAPVASADNKQEPSSPSTAFGEGAVATDSKRLADADYGSASKAAVTRWPTTWGKKVQPGQEVIHPVQDQPKALKYNPAGLPVVKAAKSKAPEVPPPCDRSHAVHAVLNMETTTQTMPVSPMYKYTWWTFDGTVPGPFVRCRVHDVLEVRYANRDADGIGHNIDFHAVTGPGGGAAATYAEAGETKTALFKMLDPGLFIYHCSAAPLPTHVANGMYGLMLVEPEGGLPPVDKEFYVLQSEIYAQEGEVPGLLEHDYFCGLAEQPKLVVLNGAEGALTEKPLLVDQGDRVRIYFGNAGPNQVASFHIIGMTLDKVYREGDLVSPPARCLQTTMVPPGGAVVVEFTAHVPGNYTLIDHAIFRVDRGCVGFLKVRPKGTDRRLDIIDSIDPPQPCPGCKLHN